MSLLVIQLQLQYLKCDHLLIFASCIGLEKGRVDCIATFHKSALFKTSTIVVDTVSGHKFHSFLSINLTQLTVPQKFRGRELCFRYGITCFNFSKLVKDSSIEVSLFLVSI